MHSRSTNAYDHFVGYNAHLLHEFVLHGTEKGPEDSIVLIEPGKTIRGDGLADPKSAHTTKLTRKIVCSSRLAEPTQGRTSDSRASRSYHEDAR